MSKVDLVTVKIITKLEAEYIFPDIERAALISIPKGNEPIRDVSGQLTLVNASVAVMSVPVRIIAKIYFNEELWWESLNPSPA